MKAPAAFTTVWLGVLLVTAAGIQVHPDTNRSRMEANSSTSWTLVFRQTVPYWFSSNQWSLNSGDSSNANYAILDQLENYRGADGKFTFKLNWPGSTYHGAAMLDQIWKQSLNPVGSSQGSSSPVAGYEAVSVPYTGKYWGGLEGGGSHALLDGSVAHPQFFYAVGVYQQWADGIPCAASTSTDVHWLGCSVVELYVGGTPSPTSSPTSSPMPSPTPTPVYATFEGGCRTQSGGLGTFTVEPLEYGDCQSACTSDPTCVAYEHNGVGTTCELHTEAITHGNGPNANGVVCYVKQAPAASATGDPHLQNIHGERFDLMRPGNAVLIQIPRGQPFEKSWLTVEADARRLGSQCADMYFQSLNITGAWADEVRAGGLTFTAGGSRDETLQAAQGWTRFGPLKLKVVHGSTSQGITYLNFYVKHLREAGAAVGGLLGEDDYTEAATPEEGCLKSMSLEKKAISNSDVGRTEAIASLA